MYDKNLFDGACPPLHGGGCISSAFAVINSCYYFVTFIPHQSSQKKHLAYIVAVIFVII